MTPDRPLALPPGRPLLALALAIGCGPGSPIEPGDTTTTTSSTTPDTSAPTTTSDPPVPTTSGDSPTGPDPATTTTTTTTTATTEPATATEATTTTTTTNDPTQTTTDTGALPACGPPCAETFEFEGDLFLKKGADLAEFACLARVRGRLDISDFDPAALFAFANLQQVDDLFALTGSPELTDLDAFACLRDVGALALSSLPALTDTSALAGIRSAPFLFLHTTGLTTLPSFAPDYAGLGALTAENNPALVDLGPAAAWPGLAVLYIDLRNNPVLADLSGLAGPLAGPGPVNVIELAELPALTSLDGLQTTTDIHDLLLRDLPQLTSLAGLQSLTSAWRIHLSDLPGLASLAGLGQLETVGRLTIGDCDAQTAGLPGLTDLTGLDALTTAGALTIVDSPQLASLTGAPALTSVQSLFLIHVPELDDADLAALLAQLAPPAEMCFGEWDQCECPLIPDMP